MNHLKNNKGGALILVIVLLMIVSVVGISMMYSITSEIKMNRAIEERAIAKYLAEAGIDHALYLIGNDNGTMVYPFVKEIVLGDRTRVYQMSITKDGDIITVNSTGKVEIGGAIKQQAALRAVIQKDGNVLIEQ